MEEAVDTYEKGGFVGRLYPDTDIISPRDMFDQVSTMCFEHRRYLLGDTTVRDLTGYDLSDFRNLDVLERYIKLRFKARAFTWVSMLDHSGITIYKGSGSHCSDPGGWDSGVIGFAFVDPKDMDRMGVPYERAEQVLDAELEEYDSYLRGEVYWYEIVGPTPDGEPGETCSGFIGYEHARKHLKEQVEYYAEREKNRA